MTTLLIAEHDNASLKDATNKALTAAKALGGEVHVLVAGKGCRPAAEAAAKLQIFLDRAEFSPGEVDGRWGALTTRVLALYRQSKGEPAKEEPKNKDGPPDMSGLDLDSVNPVFITYKVTAEDLKDVGKLAHSPAAEAKVMEPLAAALSPKPIWNIIGRRKGSAPAPTRNSVPAYSDTAKVGWRVSVKSSSGRSWWRACSQ